MQNSMIVATYVLGFLLAVVAIVAYFRKMKEGSANLKILGMELSGQGPLVFLVVGAAFIFSATGWARTQKDADASKNEHQQCEVAKSAVEEDRGKVVETAKQLNAEVLRLSNANEALVAALPAPSQQVLRAQKPELFQVQPNVVVPETLKREFEVRPSTP